MAAIRGCLMTLGLVMLLMITSCVVGVSSCSRVANPTEFGQTVDESADKTRRMVRDFMSPAAMESGSLIVRRKPVAVAVQDYADGSIHLIASQDGRRLLEIVARVLPRDGEARVEVVSDGDALAAADGEITAPELHRAIKDRFERALNAIDDHQVLPPGLLVSRLLADAEKESPF